MRPQIIKGKIYLPIACTIGELTIGQFFKFREKGAMRVVTGWKEKGHTKWITSRRLNTQFFSEESTPDYPVIQMLPCSI